jgi:hypothetical protein
MTQTAKTTATTLIFMEEILAAPMILARQLSSPSMSGVQVFLVTNIRNAKPLTACMEYVNLQQHAHF